VARGDAIVGWIKGAAKDGSEPPLYWRQLRDYFAAVIEKEQKAAKRGPRKAGSVLAEAKLPTGTYRNPFSGERVEKKRRNPRQLDAWVEEFGFTEVRSWLKS
jgi:hypothetical protein